MSKYEEFVDKHYRRIDLGSKILDALKNSGKNTDALTRDDLIQFEEFHIGGREATRKLAQLADLKKGMSALDIGSGIGGPARTLAAEFDCNVTGLDLTKEYTLAAEMLTARLGLSDKVAFRHGNAVDMPFDNESFDVVWMQHTSVNIEDKKKLFSEIHRVLRPNGKLAFHEIMAGSVPELYFPVFWASDKDLNFLITPKEYRDLLQESGFKELVWNIVTDEAIQFIKERIAEAMKGSQKLGLHVIVESDVPQKAMNVQRNAQEQRIVVVQAVFKRSD